MVVPTQQDGDLAEVGGGGGSCLHKESSTMVRIFFMVLYHVKGGDVDIEQGWVLLDSFSPAFPYFGRGTGAVIHNEIRVSGQVAFIQVIEGD